MNILLIAIIAILLIGCSVFATLYFSSKTAANEWRSLWHNAESDNTNLQAELRNYKQQKN